MYPTPIKIHQSMWIQWTFFNNFNLDDLWSTFVEIICVALPKDHCIQIPWEYINVCGYSDQFCKTLCKIPHTTYRHTYCIQNRWSHSLFLNKVQASQNWEFPIILRQNRWNIGNSHFCTKNDQKFHVFFTHMTKKVLNFGGEFPMKNVGKILWTPMSSLEGGHLNFWNNPLLCRPERYWVVAIVL